MIDPKDINELIRDGRITINETKLEFSDSEDFGLDPFVDTLTGVEIGDVNEIYPWKAKGGVYNYARFIDDSIRLYDGDHAWVRMWGDPKCHWIPVVVESLTKEGLRFYRGGDRFVSYHNSNSMPGGMLALYRNWRLPTRKELEDAGIDPDDKNQHKGSFTDGI